MNRGGFTLVEVVVSMLLTAVMVSAVFSIVLSSQAGGAKADHRLLAAQASRALSASLKQYVTGDPTTTTILGPNTYRGGAASWHIHSPGIQDDSLGDVYALQPGIHRLNCNPSSPFADSTCFLPSSLRAAPYNGTITYTVSAGNPPAVTISVDWTEPTP